MPITKVHIRKTLIVKLILTAIAAVGTFGWAAAQTPLVDSKQLIEKATALYEQKKYKEAITEWSKINRSDTNYSSALHDIAYAYYQDSNYNATLATARKGLLYYPERREDWYNLIANALDDLGDEQTALKTYDTILQFQPYYYYAYYNKAVVHQKRERFAEAKKELEQCLLINPYYGAAHYYYGLNCLYRGDLVPAYLALFTNLLIDPDGARVEKTVRILSLMAEVNDEITGYAKKYKPAKQDDFQELQDIFLSKIALNRNYKLQVSLEDAIVRQFQVILEKLEYNASDKGFAMQVYVPLYTQLYQAKQLEPLVNYVFSGLKINSVQSYVKRNKKEVGAMTDNVNAYLKELRNTEVLQFTQRKDAKTFYLWSEGYMAGKGPFKINNGEYDIYGLWTFYFQNGNIKSTGNLNDKGNKDGEWKFYYNSGILKDVSNYKDDALEGKSIAYYDNGILYSDEVYANNKLNGQAKYYYYNGLPKVFGFYKDGVKDGEEKGFKSTGFLSYTTHYKAGKQDGAFTSYHENGKVYVQRSYVADKAEGNYKEFNTDGVLVLEGMLKNDAKEGLWKGYHANGKIESEYTYVNGDIQGETKEYYDNGTLSETTTYEKGKVQGLTKAYDDEGKLYSEAVYERGRLRELRFFDRTGKQVSNFSTRNGAGNIVFYDKDGNKTAEGYYTKEGLRQGKYTTYFSSGKVATEEYYKEGELEGEKNVYYKNGKVSERLNYKNGVIDGYYTSYHENGTPKYEGWVIKGDKQGPFKSFNKQGDLTNEEYYLNNDENGFSQYFNGNKKLDYEHLFEYGWLKRVTQYDSTGKVLSDNDFANGEGTLRFKHHDGSEYISAGYKHYMRNGWYISRYPNGQVSYMQHYTNGLKDSISKEFYVDGKLENEGTYVLGKQHGVWKYYHPNGKLHYTETYKDGNEQGQVLMYNDDGTLDKEINYKDGVLHGNYKIYAENNQLAIQLNYKNGEIVSYTYEGKDGKLVTPIAVKSGKALVVGYFKNGNKSCEINFEDYIVQGVRKIYFSNGKPYIDGKRELGDEHGLKTVYHLNGNIEKQENYEYGSLHGVVKTYYENGKLKSEEHYNHGIKVGEHKFYDSNGKLTETRNYYHGVLEKVVKG